MKNVIILLGMVVLSMSIVAGFPGARFHDFIVGGVEAQRNEFPYHACVKHSVNGHICGGVILNAMHILTTAHCVDNISHQNTRVVAGEHNLNLNDGTEQEREVSLIIKHPSYNPNTFVNDIAILRLKTALSFNTAVQPAVLAAAGSGTPSGTAVVAGWGRTSENGPSSSVLRKVTIPVVNDLLCLLAYPGSMKDSMICAGENGKDACQGDSGGGLATTSTRTVIGIVSWGIGCARPGLPGVYTRISSYRSWISQNTLTEP